MVMLRNLVPQSYFDYHTAIMDDIEDQIIASGLNHYASQLLKKGLHDQAELERSLQKAITAVITARLPATKHFRTVFICCGRELIKDWLVSDLGMRLILLNADVSNPLVARLQVEILSNGFEAY